MTKNMFSTLIVFCSFFVGTYAVANHDEHKHHSHQETHDHSHRRHNAHQHGVVEFNIAQDGSELLIELIAPGADVMGFEHMPQTAQEKKHFNHVKMLLDKPKGFLAINNSANCRLKSKKAEYSLEKHDRLDNKHSGHGEFNAQYSYHCVYSNNLDSIKNSWFNLFPSTEKITIHALTDKGMKSGEITKDAMTFEF